MAIETPAGVHRIWTRRAGRSQRVKLLLLHGGPGASHDYLTVLEAPLVERGIEVIFHDQLGGGRSDRPDRDELWTIPRYVDEVEQVRRAYGLDAANFVLFGHSWGGVLALEYALAHPDALAGLIVSNMMASATEYRRYLHRLCAELPGDAVAELRALEERGEHESARYQELLATHFYPRHMCRLPVWPEPVQRSFGGINRHIHWLVQGPTPLDLSGRLADWDRTGDLAGVTVPTLTIAGQHDAMDPEHLRWVSTRVRRGSFLLCPDGSHLPMWEDTARYVAGLTQFLSLGA